MTKTQKILLGVVGLIVVLAVPLVVMKGWKLVNVWTACNGKDDQEWVACAADVALINQSAKYCYAGGFGGEKVDACMQAFAQRVERADKCWTIGNDGIRKMCDGRFAPQQ